MYKDEYHPRVKKDLKKLPLKLREEIKAKHILDILSEPEIGEKLTGNFAGVSSYHLYYAKQQYRIAYVFDEDAKTVSVLMIGKRDHFYTLLRRRV